MRILQLSDPHLVADPSGLCRGRPSLELLRHGLQQALQQLAADGLPPDRLLISGDLCHDESWGGYVRLRDLLGPDGPAAPMAPLLLPGNHDHPALLRAALGRSAAVAPGLWRIAPRHAATGDPGWSLLAIDSHRCGSDGGRLEPAQWAWLERLLRPGAHASAAGPLLVALHHPPLPIGDPGFDAIRLEQGERLLALLVSSPRVRGVVFGHVHQYWHGALPGRPEVPLLGCPSTHSAVDPVQPCPLGGEAQPGGLLLELGAEGEIRHRLLRWHPLQRP